MSLLSGALEVLQRERHSVLNSVFVRMLAERLAETGCTCEALATIDRALNRVALIGNAFDTPELLRTKGLILQSSPKAEGAKAEELFRRAMELARERSARGWELLAATSLTQLWSHSMAIAR